MLDTIQKLNPSVIIHGGASGADSLAGIIALTLNIPVKVYPAEWKKYGKSAGYIRNAQMLEEGKPDKVLAFWDGKSPGTKMMIKLTQGKKIPVDIYNE